jgi:hypothetical protein
LAKGRPARPHPDHPIGAAPRPGQKRMLGTLTAPVIREYTRINIFMGPTSMYLIIRGLYIFRFLISGQDRTSYHKVCLYPGLYPGISYSVHKFRSNSCSLYYVHSRTYR